MLDDSLGELLLGVVGRVLCHDPAQQGTAVPVLIGMNMGLLDDAAIDEFARPLGRLMLAHSNFDAAVTAMVEALQGIDDWRLTDPPNAGPGEPLKERLRILKSLLHKGDHEERFRKDLFDTLGSVQSAIEDRDVCVHGQWWRNPSDSRVYTRKFPRKGKLKLQPQNRSWTPSKIESVATRLQKAARDLGRRATQLKRSRKLG